MSKSKSKSWPIPLGACASLDEFAAEAVAEFQRDFGRLVAEGEEEEQQWQQWQQQKEEVL